MHFLCQYHTIQQVLMNTGGHTSRCEHTLHKYGRFSHKETETVSEPVREFSGTISCQKNTSGGKQLFVTSQRVPG